MKHVRKALALMLAMFVSLIVAAPAFAATETYTGTDATTDAKITVTNAEAQKYTLYKVFDATLDSSGTTPKIAYKVDASKLAAITADQFFIDNFELTPDAATGPYVKAKATFDPKNADFKTFAKAHGTLISEIDNTTAADPTVAWDKIPYGYYFIETTTGAAVTVDSTTPTANVIDKNSTIGVDKKIITNETTDATTGAVTRTYGDVNSAALGDTVKFEIEGDAKNYVGTDKITNYYVKDTMASGFTIVDDPVIYIQKADGTETAVPAAEYVVEKTADADGFKARIQWTVDGTKNTEPKYDATDKIIIRYSAKLDPAKAAKVNWDGANENKAQFWPEHDNETVPTNIPDPDPSVPHDETYTYETGVKLTKTDDATPAKKLAGAEFTLTKYNDATQAYDADLIAAIVSGSSATVQEYHTPDDPTEQGYVDGPYWKLAAGTDQYTKDDPASTIEDPNDNTKTIPEFDLTTFAEFDASKVPAGIDLSNGWAALNADEMRDVAAAQDIANWTTYGKVDVTSGTGPSVVAKGTGQTATAITATTDANGEATFAALAPGKYKIEETGVPAGYIKAADIEFEVAFDATNKVFTITQTAPQGATFQGSGAADELFTETIVDPIGTEFPETGGMGTRILYTVGGLMVAGAAIYLITKKRMASEA